VVWFRFPWNEDISTPFFFFFSRPRSDPYLFFCFFQASQAELFSRNDPLVPTPAPAIPRIKSSHKVPPLPFRHLSFIISQIIAFL